MSNRVFTFKKICYIIWLWIGSLPKSMQLTYLPHLFMSFIWRNKMSKKIDITGEKFGKLTAIKFFKRENNKTYWLFKCDCGKECFLNIHSVRTNQTRSCGCLKHSERPGAKGRVSPTKTHNMTGKRLYRIWQNMKNRCRNKNTISYKNYGGRGVCVCKDWSNDFLNFYNYLHHPYFHFFQNKHRAQL